MTAVTMAAKHSPALLTAATADKAMAFAVATGVLLVIILLARAVGHLSKAARTAAQAAAAPVPAPKSGGGGKLLLLAGAAGAGVWAYLGHRHPATAVKASPVPSPSPQPTVTRTVAPHVTPHLTLPHFLTGGDVVAIYVIAAVVAIVLAGAVLRRSS